MSDTVLDRLVECVRSALTFDPNVRVPPIALLWPDEGAQWAGVIERLAEQLPIVSLGGYDQAARTGPGYWIRCVVARTLDIGLPDGPPVVYLPGVARSALRAVDGCLAELAPIAELQYRGQWFSHPNSRDWSVRALLTHAERGLGLRIAEDAETSEALLLALGRLLDEVVDRLAKQVLDADYFRDLISPDPVRTLLGWLDDPDGSRSRSNDAQWTAFTQQCKADYGFDPNLDGEVTAAARLAGRKGAWAHVWKRFAETPERYPGIPNQLRKARPDKLIVDNVDVWPQDNENAEDQLRSQLMDFAALTAEGARVQAAQLDVEHAWRRSTVWADLDLAPLAFALEQLVALGEVTAKPLASSDLASLVTDYAERGWRADDAVLRALSSTKSGPDRQAASAAVAAMYRWWLDAAAKALQFAVGPMANAHTYQPGPAASTASGTVTVFVDGLRLDVARRVEERLAGTGLVANTTTSLAALPTVTETAKAAVFPVAAGTLIAGDDLYAARASNGARASKSVLESLATENGVQCLALSETGDPGGSAWTEVGQIDHLGHEPGLPLIDDLDREVGKIVDRVRRLLDAGWQQVDVVTDHGWILLPGGMEKVELPAATAEKKKGRCARLKDGAVIDTPSVPWFWDQDVRVAIAPGVTCFEANKEYEHGGVSPQECIVPRLTVTRGAGSASAVGPQIVKVTWLGLLCRVEVVGAESGIVTDLRALPADSSTSIAEKAKETSATGRVSLLVPDEEQIGERAYLVLVAPDEQILAQREVVVGRNR